MRKLNAKNKRFSKHKPSTLILVALQDLRAVEKDKRYDVNMANWHYKPDGFRETCSVCLAGAAMAKSLHAPIKRNALPNHFIDDIACRLDAINYFRAGAIQCGLSEMGIVPEKPISNQNIVDYSINPGKFKRQMRTVATLLKRHGL